MDQPASVIENGRCTLPHGTPLMTHPINSLQDPTLEKLAACLLQGSFHTLSHDGDSYVLCFKDDSFQIPKSQFKAVLFHLSCLPQLQSVQHDLYKEVFAKMEKSAEAAGDAALERKTKEKRESQQ